MGDEYQLRRDIDKIYDKTYNYDEDIWNIYTKQEINDILDELYYDKGKVDELIQTSVSIDDVYPVGSIYVSVNSTNPSVLFGGTWVQLKDTFLLACGDIYENGATGGEASVTLTANQSGIMAHGHGMAHTHNHRHQTGRRDVYVASGQAAGAIGYSSTSSSNYNTSYDDTASSKSTTDNNTAQNASESHNNMPPYLAVYVWQRIPDYVLGSITLLSSSNSITTEESATLTATVLDEEDAPIKGVKVMFFDSTTKIGGATTDDDGEATHTFTSQTTGSHSLTAIVDGESSESITVTVTLPLPRVTSVSLVSSSYNVFTSESATLTATVLDQYNEPMENETVTFYDGDTSLGTSTTNSSGVATKSFSSQTVGSHTLSATCSTVTSNNVRVSVSLPSSEVTTVSLATSSATILTTKSAKLTATVLDQYNEPMGGLTVTFYDGNTSLGTATTNISGVATKSFSSQTVGSHSLTASCSNVTSSAVSITVTYVVSSISLTADKSILSYADSESATLTAQLMNSGSPVSVDGASVYFYEVLTPSFTLNAEPNIIQTGETTDITCKVKDEDGSIAKNTKTHFYIKEE